MTHLRYFVVATTDNGEPHRHPDGTIVTYPMEVTERVVVVKDEDEDDENEAGEATVRATGAFLAPPQ